MFKWLKNLFGETTVEPVKEMTAPTIDLSEDKPKATAKKPAAKKATAKKPAAKKPASTAPKKRGRPAKKTAE